MSRSDLQAITLRGLHFEMFEVRLVLSAQPASEMQADRHVDSDEPLLLADVHASTGVSHAHNSLGLNGFGQTVAVIDSGLAYDHEALGGGFGSGYRVVGGWDFAENDSDPFDDAPAGLHGTHIAGIIGGQHAEHLGVAPSVDLVALRVFDDKGGSDFEWVESALQWVYDHKSEFEHPITTVNLSLGAKWGGSDLPEWATLEDEFVRLRRSGIFVSVAAGNNFKKDRAVGLNYPAASPHVVPVASYGSDDSVSPFSRRSNRVLVAPGEDITSTATDFIYDFNGITDDFYSASGTSMAAAYVSGVSVLVRQAMEEVGRQDISHDSIYKLLRNTAELVYDPATKSRYRHIDVQAALDAVMPAPVPDLGELDLQQTIALSASTAGAWYRFTAARSGVLTLETLNGGHGDVNLELFDANQRRLVSDGEGPNRVDATVRAGQSLFVRLQGNDEDVAVRVTNLVSAIGQTLEVFGTPKADEFQLDLGVGQWLSVNGVTYDLPGGAESTIRIHGGAGEDSLQIATTDGDETVWLRADSVRVQSPGVLVEADGTKRNYVYSIGGEDRAYLYDSEFDDACYDLREYSLLSGLDTFNHVEGFAFVRAYSSHGGTDCEWFYDSTYDDVYMRLPQYRLLNGGSFHDDAHGLENVLAYAIHGGDDTAEGSDRVRAALFDSNGDDVYLGRPDHGLLKGAASVNYAFGFDTARVRAYRGGNDRLQGAPIDDIFTSRSTLKSLLGVNYHHPVHDFEVNNAYAGEGGLDHVVFNELSVRDAVYRQASLPSWLEAEKGVRSQLPERPVGCCAQLTPDPFFDPVIDVHQGDCLIEASGYLAVDYLLRDDDTWL